jgi:cytochrome c peroxidase
MFTKKQILCFVISMSLVALSAGLASAEMLNKEEMLGRMLYFDENLSSPAGQSCASCHHPDAAFADPDYALPVSEGVIEGRFGTRNSPTAAYAAQSPDFYFNTVDELFMGGQFWDGRAATLEEQAKGPFLNPVEMNNTKRGVIEAVRASDYAMLFKEVYGNNSLNNVDKAYNLVAQAIATYERSKELNQFTSKFDYFLQGKVKLSAQELRGLQLFESEEKGNCAACHPTTSPDGGATPPLLTDFSYDNLGVPKNPEIEALIGMVVPVDYGLGVTVDSAENGKFKVSSLRNIAKTAPYAHNGFFKTLKEIVHFYNTRDVDPSWPAPEVTENVNSDELGNLGLTSREEDDIVAFLMTLTDGYQCKNCGKK